MAIRESLNRHRKLSLAISVAFVAIAIAFVAYEWTGKEGGGQTTPQDYFTTDDGKTWFLSDAANVPPFDVGGKVAVRAHLFRCGAAGAPFVGYLERINQGPKPVQQAALVLKPGQMAEPPRMVIDGSEVKRPGSGNWVKRNDPAAREVLAVKCPDGTGTPEAVRR